MSEVSEAVYSGWVVLLAAGIGFFSGVITGARIMWKRLM